MNSLMRTCAVRVRFEGGMRVIDLRGVSSGIAYRRRVPTEHGSDGGRGHCGGSLALSVVNA